VSYRKGKNDNSKEKCRFDLNELSYGDPLDTDVNVLLEIYCAEVRSAFTFYSEDVAGFSPVKLHCIINCHTNMKPQAHEKTRTHTTYFSIYGDWSRQLAEWPPT
jgi:hypothetical protein